MQYDQKTTSLQELKWVISAMTWESLHIHKLHNSFQLQKFL